MTRRPPRSRSGRERSDTGSWASGRRNEGCERSSPRTMPTTRLRRFSCGFRVDPELAGWRRCALNPWRRAQKFDFSVPCSPGGAASLNRFARPLASCRPRIRATWTTGLSASGCEERWERPNCSMPARSLGLRPISETPTPPSTGPRVPNGHGLCTSDMAGSISNPATFPVKSCGGSSPEPSASLGRKVRGASEDQNSIGCLPRSARPELRPCAASPARVARNGGSRALRHGAVSAAFDFREMIRFGAFDPLAAWRLAASLACAALGRFVRL